MELGELITLYRKQAGMTIDELCEKSGVPKGTIKKIISGITKAPTLENVRSIAYALGKKLSDFDVSEEHTFLDPNETIFDGTKREIKEETGCDVELTGVLQIGNQVLKDDTFVSIIFSTKLLDDNITYNPNEILDVKWFTYEELLNMKDDLRAYNWIINSITALIENKVADIDLVKMM